MKRYRPVKQRKAIQAGIDDEPLRMKNGAAFEIHSCLDPQRSFTRQRWKKEIREAMKNMSARSRWQRFASGLNELSESQLDYLTDIDGRDRVAWCALVRQGNDYRGIGVSRYVRLLEEIMVAEFAVTVIDEFQGQGVGRALLGRLVESARQNGIHVLRGFIFPSNTMMLELCKRLHATTRQVGMLMQVDIPIPPPAGAS